MVVANTADIRSQNKKNIITVVRFGEPATKKAIADQLGLSFATVSNLCNQLVEDGVLSIASSANSSGGRIPGLISLEPNSRAVLCLDLNRPELANAALLNLRNEMIDSVGIVIRPDQGLDELIQACYEAALALLNRHQMDMGVILGVGAAIPGIFYKHNNSVINSTNPIFENQMMKMRMEDVFQLPVYLENESNILALATSTKLQHSSGARPDVTYLYLGEGLGVGIMHRGAIFTGNRGFGGEVSHIPIGSRQYACYCGRRGCVETELSLAGFWRKYYGMDVVPPAGSLSFFWREFVKAVQSGERRALDVAEENGRLLGKLVSLLDNLFDPDEVYVGGIIEPIYDLLYPFMLEEAQSAVVTKSFYFPPIRNGGNFELTMLQGCADMVFKKWEP